MRTTFNRSYLDTMQLFNLPRMKVCRDCEFGKPLPDFHFRTSWNGKSYPTWICKKCHSKNHKEKSKLYKESGGCWKCGNEIDTKGNFCLKCKEDARINITKRKIANKKKAIELLGGKCSKCGFKTDCIDVYDFHHRDQATKQYDVGKILAYKWSRIEKEIAKCDLLCGNCHREIHWKDYESELSYPPQKYSKKFARERGLCLYCGVDVSKTNNKTCEDCRKIASAARRSYTRNNKRKLIDLLGRKCDGCGLVSNIDSIYDIDHENPILKKDNIADLLRGKWEYIEEEIKNGVTLKCVNCHRQKHAKELNGGRT